MKEVPTKDLPEDIRVLIEGMDKLFTENNSQFASILNALSIMISTIISGMVKLETIKPNEVPKIMTRVLEAIMTSIANNIASKDLDDLTDALAEEVKGTNDEQEEKPTLH